MKEWYSSPELALLNSMPNTASNVTRKATKEGWKKRKREGIKGIGFEYHISSLPLEVQNELGANKQEIPQKESDDHVIGDIDIALLEGSIEAADMLQARLDQPMTFEKRASITGLTYMTALESEGLEEQVDYELLKDSINATELLQAKAKMSMTIHKKAKIIALIYMTSIELGEVDEQFSNKLFEIAS